MARQKMKTAMSRLRSTDDAEFLPGPRDRREITKKSIVAIKITMARVDVVIIHSRGWILSQALIKKTVKKIAAKGMNQR